MYNLTVGFSRHKGFSPLSWLIQLIERVNFSHAYIKIQSVSLNRYLIYQATGSGVYFVGTDLFEQKNIIVKEKGFEITEESKTSFLQWAVDNSGKSYSQLGLIGLGIKRFIKLFGININNPFQQDQQYFCTKLVSKALEDLEIIPVLNEDNIGLKELDKIIESL